MVRETCLLLLAMTVFGFNASASSDSNECEITATGRNSVAIKTLADSKAINALLEKVKTGELSPTQIPPSLPGQMLSFWLKNNGTYRRVEGALTEIRQTKDGLALVINSNVTDRPFSPGNTLVPLDSVSDVSTIGVTSNANAARVREKLEGAEPGMGVSFINWFFKGLYEGVLKELGPDYMIIQENDHSRPERVSLNSLDAGSIMFFKFGPKKLKLDEAQALAILHDASNKQEKVRFLRKSKQGISFQYGQPSEVVVGTDGIFRVKLGRDGSKTKITDIILPTVGTATDSKDNGQTAIQLLTEAVNKNKAVAFAIHGDPFYIGEQTEFQGVITSIRHTTNGSAKIRITDDAKKESQEIDAKKIIAGSIVTFSVAPLTLSEAGAELYAKLQEALKAGKGISFKRDEQMAGIVTHQGLIERFETGTDGMIRVYIKDDESGRLETFTIESLTRAQLKIVPE